MENLKCSCCHSSEILDSECLMCGCYVGTLNTIKSKEDMFEDVFKDMPSRVKYLEVLEGEDNE